MTTVATTRTEKGEAEPRPQTIGAVCESLREEFPDISVSKIRYLEDQGLIAPRRTRGGYRLFSPEDMERLTTILRLQRDEFLPLRVIREALAGPGASAERTRRRSVGLSGREDEIDVGELCERAAISRDFLRELEEYGVVVSRVEGGEHLYRESEGDVAIACARLARFGIDARHLRTFLTATSRQATLVEQLVAPGLRSRNPDRRKGALDDLDALARVAQELSHLLFLRDLRAVVERTS
jgi:DNA-binding transcriptional MerR regulator